jgi:hypothetical protein
MDKSAIAKLYKHNLPLVHKKMGHKSTTSGGELDDFARRYIPEHYGGIYLGGERLPVLRNNSFIIINQPRNQHWIGAFNYRNKLYEYDSYARRDFIGPDIGDKYIDFNTKTDALPDQSVLDTDCGQRVLATMLSVFNKKL